MKHLFISELLLLSQKEKKAKKVTFDSRRTLIQGKNHTGKSSLIKSIYRTLGCEVLLHPGFKSANCASLLKFSVDDTQYQMLRDQNTFALFSEEGKLIRKFASVTNELGPYLSNLFDFKPLFQTPKNTFLIPPPAFLFLPFYIDQDSSWSKSWNSFERLNQFKSPRTQAISYHSGIRPNDYYTTKQQIEEYLQMISSVETELNVTNKILKEIREKLGSSEFNFDVEQFRDEINELLVEAEKLKQKEEILKHDLLDYYNIKSLLQSQIEIVKHSILENHSDLEFASTELDTHVDCPLCGAQYQNSFSERFAIANDEKKGRDLLIELNKELSEIDLKITNENNRFVSVTAEIKKIEQLLLQKKGDLQLKDLIDSSGKNQVRVIFSERSKELNEIIVTNTIEKSKLDKKLRALENRKRKLEITYTFSSYMTNFLRKLDINSLNPEDYKTLNTAIESKELGSSRPRALIAYYYSFFNLMKRYSSTTYCPIIIDSPNQQDQDIEHIDKIMEFINQNQPENSQMILGLAETYGVNFDCKTISLTEKYSLLQSSEYNNVYDELHSKLEAVWFNNFNN